MEWQLEFSDGPAVKGFVSLFAPPNAAESELKPDGKGHHKKDGYWRHDPYAVTFVGTVEVSGKVEDEDGKAVSGVLILIEPVYSAPEQVKTDGGGAWKAKGFVEEEEFDVVVTAGTGKIEGKVVDTDDKAVPGATLRLVLDGGQSVEVTSGKDGSFKVEDRVAGEGFLAELVGIEPGFAAEGKFEDEDGKPLAGIQAKLEIDGGGQLVVTSGEDGKFRVPGLFPNEGFSLEVLNHPLPKS
jgi:hypothetical protein